MRPSVRVVNVVAAAAAMLCSGCVTWAEPPRYDRTLYNKAGLELPAPATSRLTIYRYWRSEIDKSARPIFDVPDYLLETVRGANVFGTVERGEDGDYKMEVGFRRERKLTGLSFIMGFFLPGMLGVLPALGAPVMYAGCDITLEMRLFFKGKAVSVHTATMETRGMHNWYSYPMAIGAAEEYWHEDILKMITSLANDVGRTLTSEGPLPARRPG